MNSLNMNFLHRVHSLKVLIVHPEGNINNNPNLFALAVALSNNGYEVDILSEKHGNKYQNGAKYFSTVLLKDFSVLLKARKEKGLLHCFIRLLLKLWGRRYSLIIGVDSAGVIVADTISQASRSPLAYISYEIFFKEEIGGEAKQEEVVACRNVLFAICQDDLRAKKLSEENEIPLEKILCIPTSGRDVVTEQQEINYLKNELGIEPEKNIALYMGSISGWAGIRNILYDLQDWPDDWVLVLHGRYSGKEQYSIVEDLSKRAKAKLYLSTTPLETFAELYQLPLSADVGLAMYFPDYQSPYTGNNLAYLGWSSGKISTYFQCGLPVIVNEIGAISRDVIENDLGYVLSSQEKISSFLSETTKSELLQKRQRCREFFLSKIDFKIYEERFLEICSKFCNKSDEVYTVLPTPFIIMILNVYAKTKVIKKMLFNYFQF